LLLSGVGAPLEVFDGMALGIEESLGDEDGAPGMLLCSASSAFKNPSTSSPSSSKANNFPFDDVISLTDVKKFEGAAFHHWDAESTSVLDRKRPALGWSPFAAAAGQMRLAIMKKTR
jgi:hypothetical protein